MYGLSLAYNCVIGHDTADEDEWEENDQQKC